MINYQSNLRNVQRELKEKEERALTAVGIFVRGESQVRSPVRTGNLRDSNDYKVDLPEHRVIVGNSAEYAEHVHEGTSRQKAQPWLENSVMENVSRIKSLVKEYMK